MHAWGTVIAGFVVAAAMLAAVFCVLRGLAPGTLPPRRDDYLREPPNDLPPAVVTVLLRGDPGREGLAATVIDLARRGVIQVTGGVTERGDGADVMLIRTAGRHASVRPFERRVLKLIFSKSRLGAEVPMPALRAWAAGHEREAGDWYEEWRREVIDEAAAVGLMRAVPIEYRGMAAAAALLGLMFAVAMWPSAWSPILVAAGIGAIAITFRRSWITRKGVKVRRTYQRLGNYLRDFGRFHEKAPEAVALWDDYLVLAVALGMARRSIEALSFLSSLPVVREDSDRGGSWWPHVGMLLPQGQTPLPDNDNHSRINRFMRDG